MRRLVSLLLVALIAFAAGAAGANGTFTRILGDARIGGATSTPTPISPASTPFATSTAPTLPSATPSPTASPTSSARSTTAPSIPAPVALAQLNPRGGTLAISGWTNAAGAILQVMAPAGRKGLRAEVEVRPSDQPFSGTPTGSAPVSGGTASIGVHDLPSGHYHWQARLVANGAAGDWMRYAHGGSAFAVRREPPPAPLVSSPTDPHPGQVYATSTISLTWTAPADPSGIAGYSYRLDTDPHGQARLAVRTQAQQVMLGGLDSGQYYFHVRALDGAGNWGPETTFPVHIDVTLPKLDSYAFSGYYFNPMLESLHLDFKVSKITHITVGIYNTAGVRVRHIVPSGLKLPGVSETVAWDGRDDKGALVPAGTYAFAIRLTDRIGNTNVYDWGGFTVSYKRIVISLSQQRLWAFDGTKYLMNTLVTTGNKLLPTPTGLFHIIFARHPFTFHSPWPKGSPYYYPPSPVNYALYFHDGGYFIHDAPWRTTFGPGTNEQIGTPGQNYTGTHGCVNVPEDAMTWLYNWATPGTAVQINP